MTSLSAFVTGAYLAAPAPAEDLGRLLVWIAVPAVILATIAAAAIKRAILSSPRFRDRRPPWRTIVWVGISDIVAWAVLWPALLVVRIQGNGANRGLWIVALLLVVALGYTGNRYGFSRALSPQTAGSLRGTLLAELFTILMPILAIALGLVLFVVLGALGI
jgi:hypothetical protein